VTGVADQTVPLLGEVTTSVVQVNAELTRVDTIAANVEEISGNARALTALFSATLGSPVIKIAAFSYGVRRAINGKNEDDMRKRIKLQMKADKAAAKASKRSSR
jgi:hypothetical protein